MNAPLQADAAFTKSQCNNGVQLATKHGLRYYYNGTAATVAKAPTLDATIEALAELRSAGVNVLVGCTYMSTTVQILAALEARANFSAMSQRRIGYASAIHQLLISCSSAVDQLFISC